MREKRDITFFTGIMDTRAMLNYWQRHDADICMAVNGVEEYVFSHKWHSRDESSSKIAVFVFEPAEKAAKALGITPEEFLEKRNQWSEELYERFGRNCFADILAGGEKARRIQHIAEVYNGGYDKFNDFVLIEVEDMIVALCLDDCGSSTFTFDECQEEIDFLAKYSLNTIKVDFEFLDEDKLKFLYRVLEGGDGNESDKLELGIRISQGNNSDVHDDDNESSECVIHFVSSVAPDDVIHYDFSDGVEYQVPEYV